MTMIVDSMVRGVGGRFALGVQLHEHETLAQLPSLLAKHPLVMVEVFGVEWTGPMSRREETREPLGQIAFMLHTLVEGGLIINAVRVVSETDECLLRKAVEYADEDCGKARIFMEIVRP